MAVDFDDDIRLAKKEAIVLSTAAAYGRFHSGRGSGYGCGGDYEREAFESSDHYSDGSSDRAMAEIAIYST
ncbi:hypothetical protein B296_00038362 [Ensete ventricosum]|uniref:Uncharacterized protein n=1 Tax=Ensete ventricosum TaxID=4639 RepID=A0A426ZCZ1_ENSVE|nr:hypothetical protein B296_00038362 [Ensete ventricosum]